MCDDCDWEQWVDDIEELANKKRYSWAADTLVGIMDWVEENQHITEKQILSINNIVGKQNLGGDE